jgi:hypothetical protein
VLLVGLQLIIALTGNYAFFNLLTMALCVFLLDDVALAGLGALGSAQSTVNRFRQAVLAGVVVVTVPISVVAFMGALGIGLPGTAMVSPLANAIAPFRSVNAYGLFAVMTPTRSEIILEGSEDGVTWLEYEFKYKAGEVHRRPPWVAPHQPRVDWQMWFAALGRFDEERWFQSMCLRILEGDAAILGLLERDPFHGRAPRFLRAVLYRYRFTSRAAADHDGAWWTRERLGEYSPVLSLSVTAQPISP